VPLPDDGCCQEPPAHLAAAHASQSGRELVEWEATKGPGGTARQQQRIDHGTHTQVWSHTATATWETLAPMQLRKCAACQDRANCVAVAVFAFLLQLPGVMASACRPPRFTAPLQPPCRSTLKALEAAANFGAL
jgi:hypothetical protein